MHLQTSAYVSQRLERSNQYGIHWMYAHPIIRKCWSTVFRIGIHNSFEHSSFMKNVLMKPLILYTYVKIICGVKFCHYVFYFVNHSTVAPVVHSITLYIQYTVDFIFIRNIFFCHCFQDLYLPRKIIINSMISYSLE